LAFILNLVSRGERIISAKPSLAEFNPSARRLGCLLLEHFDKHDRVRIDPIDDAPGARQIIDPQLMAV
jgi:hypothetical protein